MRTIKFRAWSPKWKKMVYPDSKYTIDVHTETIWEDFSDDESAELMQFTGLLDKNGKEIYEGDIVIHKNYPTKMYIGWDIAKCQFRCFLTGLDSSESINGLQDEIIDNIYENAELLNKTN